MRFIERYEDVVKKYNDRPAVIDDRETLTYEDLDTRASRIYAYLKQIGYGKEDIVMIKLPRGVNTVAAILGVIKAGCAFVPLEDDYPSERSEYIRKDSSCKTVLDEHVLNEIYSTTEPLKGHEPTGLHDAACAVYTSGSTGNPKGVLHEYGNLDRIMLSMLKDEMWEKCGFVPSFYFIAAVFFLMMVITSADSMYIISKEILRDSNRLKDFILEKKLDWIYLPPSYIRLYDDPSPYLKRIFTGSEPANGLYYPNGRPKIINTYSMSEAGFNVLSTELDRAYDVAPVGKPTLDIPYYLYDDEGNEVRGAGQGELCFVNEYVRGYINLPEKTASAWKNGIYHTGDIARRDEDGRYYIIGRTDDMIKINGNRIEPAEIEARVQDLTGLRKVIAKGFSQGNRSFICVYYIREEAQKLGIMSNEKLTIDKERLKKHLPNYMIPAYYVALDAFPLNANGKIAKKELKCPEVSDYGKEYTAPDNEMEAYFCEEMAKLLKLERFSATGDFFEMGGSSVNAIVLAAECKKYPITVDMLYRYPSPRLLADNYSGITVSSLNDTSEISNRCKNELVERAQNLKKEFDKNEKAYLYSNSYFSLNKAVLVDPLLSPCQQYTFKEPIQPNRLYEAVNKAANKFPYMKMSVENKKGEFLCTFHKNEKNIPVFSYDKEVAFGSEENNGHQIMVKYKGNDLFIYCNHVLTDGYGINIFISALISQYFGYDAVNEVDITTQPDYFADLMERNLPVSENYVPKDYYVTDRFIIPERDENDKCCISETFSISRRLYDNFCRRNSISSQIAMSILISEAISRVHPENKNTIVVRSPINTRNIFGIPNTFQNASVPHIFLNIDPEELKNREYSSLTNKLRTEFEEQYRYDNMAQFTNRMANRVRGAGEDVIREDLTWYKGHTQIFTSDMGQSISDEISENIVNISMHNSVAPYPLMLYLSHLGERTIFQMIRDFRSDVYVTALKEVINSSLFR